MNGNRDPVLEKHYRKSLEFAAARLSELSFEEGLIGQASPPGPRRNQGMQGVQGVQGLVGVTGLQGNRGARGPQGEPGRDAYCSLRREFVMPPVGSTEIADVDHVEPLQPRMSVFVEGVGYAAVVEVRANRRELVLRNAYGETPGRTALPWAFVTPASPASGPAGESGPPGVDGMPGERGEQGEQGIQGDQGIQGEQGERGEKGERGQESFSRLSNEFRMPPIGQAEIAFIQEPSPIPNGSIVTVGTLGYLRRGTGGALNIVLWNDVDVPTNQPPGSVAPAGSFIVASGVRGERGRHGPQGEPGPPAEVGEWVLVTLNPGWTGVLRLRLVNNRRSVVYQSTTAAQSSHLGSLQGARPPG